MPMSAPPPIAQNIYPQQYQGPQPYAPPGNYAPAPHGYHQQGAYHPQAGYPQAGTAYRPPTGAYPYYQPQQ